MKAKLIKIREALQHALVVAKTEGAIKVYVDAIKEYDELLAMMDSPELVERVSSIIKEFLPSMPFHPDDIMGNIRANSIAVDAAQAAINSIKGE